ncbi:MAG: lipid-A-disaccharide synthase [Alphaproteobacteria bacterium]
MIFIIAGEPSGDRLGASLMQGLNAERELQFIGVGGPMMAEQGLESLFPMEELSIMGLAEVLPKLPKLLRRMRETADAVEASEATALITIDSPDFCLRVAKKVKAQQPDLPIIHYVAPSVWAWRPKRAVKMARYVDHVLALLPFEPPYMEAAGMSCDFVGHPVVADKQASAKEIADFRAEIGVTERQKLLTLLPGSRAGEVARLGPVFRDIVVRLRADIPELAVVIPSVGKRVDDLKHIFDGLNVTILDPRDLPVDLAEAHKRACYAASGAALAASGTVSLELAAAGTPMVIAYKMHWLTAFILKRRLRVTTVTLVNLVTETRAVPEFLLEDCSVDKIHPTILELLTDQSASESQRQASVKAMELLGKGVESAGTRAALSVIKHLKM